MNPPWPLLRLDGKSPVQKAWQSIPADELWPPVGDSNAGLRMDGRTGIDCDSQEAVDWWEANGPTTPYVSESRDGHRIYHYAGEHEGGQWIGSGGQRAGEVKSGSGHQVVIPPSISPVTGQPVRWVGTGGELRPDVGDLPSLGAQDLPVTKKDPTTFYGRTILRRHIADIDAAVEGERNNVVGGAARVIGRYVAGGEIGKSRALEALEAAVERVIERTGDDGWYRDDLDGETEIERALRLGMEEPQRAPEGDRPKIEVDPLGIFVDLADIAAEPVDWLWYPRIPLGKLTLIAGKQGLGKSYVTAKIAADLSTGTGLPDTAGRVAPCTVVMAIYEDGYGDTIRPRLEMLGADLRKVKLVSLPTGDGKRRKLTAEDLAILEAGIGAVGDVKLLVVDPLSSMLGGKVDHNKNEQVREVLESLAEMAGRTGVAVLGVCHLNKDVLTDVIYRISGANAFSQVPRSVLFVGKDEDSGRTAVAHAKSNLGPPASTLVYEISGPPGATANLTWKGVDRSLEASGLVGGGAGKGPQGGGKQEECAVLVRELLADGPMASRELQEAAEDAGFSSWTLKRSVRVHTNRQGREWISSIPPSCPQGCRDCADMAPHPLGPGGGGNGEESDTIQVGGPGETDHHLLLERKGDKGPIQDKGSLGEGLYLLLNDKSDSGGDEAIAQVEGGGPLSPEDLLDPPRRPPGQRTEPGLRSSCSTCQRTLMTPDSIREGICVTCSQRGPYRTSS